MVIFAILTFVSVGSASAATIYVPENYAKIQWAVDNATAGDIIIVRNGTYTENVYMDERLTIRSDNGSENCIVQAADPDAHVFDITADYVNISGFTVKGATGSKKAGTYLDKADHCTITNINASNNWYGIYLDSSCNNSLYNNYALETSGMASTWISLTTTSFTTTTSKTRITPMMREITSGTSQKPQGRTLLGVRI